MGRTEDELKRLIVSRYGSMLNFTKKVGLSNSTVATILTRGIGTASVTNVIKMCKELGISTDKLAYGEIVPIDGKWKIDSLNEYINTLKAKLSTSDMMLDGEVLKEYEKKLLIGSFENSIDLVRFMRIEGEEKGVESK